MQTIAGQLVLHGAIVITIGLLDGIPYGRAIISKDEERIRAWRLAHQALCLGGTTMLAIASIVAVFPFASWEASAIVWSYIVSGYGFAFAMNYEPFARPRGLYWSKRNGRNNLVFVGNIVGSIGSLVGAIVLVIAAIRIL